MLFLIPPTHQTSYPEDEARPQPVRRLLVRSLAALATLGITGWCCSLGWFPAILSLLVAKHVLVAILLMDLGVDKAS